MTSVIASITFLNSAYTSSLSILLIHFFTSLFSSFTLLTLSQSFTSPLCFLFISTTHRRMANSPIEDTTDIATQPNALIIGRCVCVCLLMYNYTLIPAHIHVDAYAYAHFRLLIFSFFYLLTYLVGYLLFLSFIYHSFNTRLLKSLPCLLYLSFATISHHSLSHSISIPSPHSQLLLTFSHHFLYLFLTRSSSCSMVLDYRTVSTVHAILYYNVRYVTL